MMRRKHAGGGKRRLIIVAVVAAGLVLLLAGAAFAGYRYERGNSGRLLPGVRIAGIDVGGMTRAEAERALAANVEAITGRVLEIKAGTRVWAETAGGLGTLVDVKGALDGAFDVSGSYGWASRLYHRVLHRPVRASIALAVSYDPAPVDRLVTSIAGQIRSQPLSASLDYRDGHLVLQHSRVGTSLATATAERAVLAAVRAGRATVGLPVRRILPAIGEDDLGMTIVIRLSQNRLYLYSGTSLVRSYPVATGQLGRYDTPQGHFQIINKRVNPTWVNPARTTWGKDEPAVIPPGPDNPLGTRALDLSAPGIRIHGTPTDSSIGHYASHGCIRMHIPDSEDLFDRVQVGTVVIIAW
jgi:lipoprotein-anchoring transpeptidase ErfK/SrfK